MTVALPEEKYGTRGTFDCRRVEDEQRSAIVYYEPFTLIKSAGEKQAI